MNYERVAWVHREEDCRFGKRLQKHSRVYLSGGSCIRLVPFCRNHVSIYDFAVNRFANGKLIRMLTVIDDSASNCLAIRVDFRLTSDDVLNVLSSLFVSKRLPDHIRSDNDNRFTANVEGSASRAWCGDTLR